MTPKERKRETDRAWRAANPEKVQAHRLAAKAKADPDRHKRYRAENQEMLAERRRARQSSTEYKAARAEYDKANRNRRAEYFRARRAAKGDEIRAVERASAARRREKCREELKAKAKAYYADNKERSFANSKAWRDNNKERHRLNVATWAAFNPEKVEMCNAKKRLAKMSGIPTKAVPETIAEIEVLRLKTARAIREHGRSIQRARERA